MTLGNSGSVLSNILNEDYLQEPFSDMMILVQVKKYFSLLPSHLIFQTAYRPSQHAP